jgi:hypothetical protein
MTVGELIEREMEIVKQHKRWIKSALRNVEAVCASRGLEFSKVYQSREDPFARVRISYSEPGDETNDILAATTGDVTRVGLINGLFALHTNGETVRVELQAIGGREWRSHKTILKVLLDDLRAFGIQVDDVTRVIEGKRQSVQTNKRKTVPTKARGKDTQSPKRMTASQKDRRERQARVKGYCEQGKAIAEMAQVENVSESTIKRDLKDLQATTRR